MPYFKSYIPHLKLNYEECQTKVKLASHPSSNFLNSERSSGKFQSNFRHFHYTKASVRPSCEVNHAWTTCICLPNVPWGGWNIGSNISHCSSPSSALLCCPLDHNRRSSGWLGLISSTGINAPIGTLRPPSFLLLQPFSPRGGVCPVSGSSGDLQSERRRRFNMNLLAQFILFLLAMVNDIRSKLCPKPTGTYWHLWWPRFQKTFLTLNNRT